MSSSDLPPLPPVSDGESPPAGLRHWSARRLALVGAVSITLICVLVGCGLLVVSGGAYLYNRQRSAAIQLPTAPTADVRQARATTLPAVTSPSLISPTASVHPAETALPLSSTAPVSSADLTVSATTTAMPLTATPLTVTLTPVVSTPVTTQTGSQTATLTVTVTARDTARQLRIFDDLWQIVDQNYVYTDFNGLNWSAVRITTQQQISAGIAYPQFYELMQSVVTSLHDDHSYFLSPDEARQEQEDYQGSGEYVGVGVITDYNLEKRYAYVLQVLPGSPALDAGIKAHDHILDIDGQPSISADGKLQIARLRGPAGTYVTVTVQSPGAAPRVLTMQRSSLSTASPVESRILTGTKRIGYILIPTFFEESIADNVRTALRGLLKGGRLDGLIVDMRINNGGAYPILLSNLGFFTSGTAGYLTDRQGVRSTLAVRAERVGNSQTVPLVVLIGPSTASYAEVYAGALQAKGRAQLIGQKSAGNIETLHGHEFEDGSEAWIAEETFRLPNGLNWEGKGLSPNIPVNQSWDEYTTDNDLTIAAAVTALGRMH